MIFSCIRDRERLSNRGLVNANYNFLYSILYQNSNLLQPITSRARLRSTMRYISLSIIALSASLATAQLSAQQIEANIDALSDLSSQTDSVARSISITNFFSTTPVKHFHLSLNKYTPNSFYSRSSMTSRTSSQLPTTTSVPWVLAKKSDEGRIA
jgi:hypothetical protein